MDRAGSFWEALFFELLSFQKRRACLAHGPFASLQPLLPSSYLLLIRSLVVTLSPQDDQDDLSILGFFTESHPEPLLHVGKGTPGLGDGTCTALGAGRQ